ncbi:MAG: translation initiation factor IF-2 subunit alpha [Candidatus Aenigmatarchaeota archaeon]
MVKREDDYPSSGELIVGTVKNVSPYSAFVSLDEYPGRDGMIHVSEIAKKWVRDIKNWVKKGDTVVCLVLSVNKDKGHVNLSLKKVSDNQKNRRLQTWKRDQRGENLLRLLAESQDKTLDEIYDELGFEIQDNFRDLLEPFELCLKKGKEILEKRGLEDEWIDEIDEIAQKNLSIKEVKISKEVDLRCFESNGVEVLRKNLKYINDNYDVEIEYVSSPKYRFSIKTKDPKKGDKKLGEALGDLKERIDKKNCTCEILNEN